MEEIKVGEYVRSKEGIIDKVIVDYKGKCNNPNCKEKHISCEKDYYDEKDIVKHSFNIIDLIEVGDYVNGREVEETTRNGFITLKSFADDDYGDFNILENKYIESIVTKEQFESMKYKVGGK